ncbi:MAG TPA: hypothetical protein VI916_00250 [Acidimicrobiia bacterium]|nr:hypothetical protein [Acidimicrobiia bacterium]
MAQTTLITLIDDLLRDPEARMAYGSDGEAYLADRGWSDLDPEDLAEALSAARHALAADVAGDLPDPDLGADPYAVLDHVAGVEPLSLPLDDLVAAVGDGREGVDAESPRFGSGTDAADGPEPATAEAESDRDDGAEEGSLADPVELPEQGPMADVSASVEPVDDEEAGGPEEEDDWLDPLNP